MNGIEQIKKKVKNQSLPPVIALSGNERALIDDALNALRDGYLTPSSADFNHHKFSVMEDDIDGLMSTLDTMPFLASHRLVEVHNAEKLNTSLVSSLCEYAQKPCASTLLVLIFNKADKRNKLLAQLDKLSAHILLSIDALNDRREFIHNEAKALGLVVPPAAVDLLLVMTDGDLLDIKNALEKMAIVGNDVSVEVIQDHIVAKGNQDVFLLARHMGEGRLDEALVALARLRNSDENAIKFLGVLMWQLRVLVHIRSCLDQGRSDWDIRKEVSVYGDRFTWMANVAKKKNLQFHIERLSKLLDCDRAIKTGAVHEHFHVIEKFAYQCAQGL